jgi:hypothetical protein
VEELVWETLFGCLESCPPVLDVDYLEGTEPAYFLCQGEVESQLVECFITALFYWSKAWVFTSSTSIIQFIDFIFLDPHSYSLVIT